MTKIFVRDILKEEAERNNVSVEAICGPARDRKMTDIRHYAMWRARKEAQASFPLIGQIFNKDHTSVVHAYYRLEKLFGEGRDLSICAAPPAKSI